MILFKRSWLRPRRRLTVFAVLVSAGTLLSALSMAAPARADVSGIGIVSGISGNCLDDWDDAGQGAVADNFTCNGSPAQTWNVIGNTIQLDGAPGPLCLDVSWGGVTDGTRVQLWGCNGTGSQVWIQEAGSAGDVLFNPQSGKCLDDPNGHPTPAGGPPIQLQIWYCLSGDLNQVWSFG